MGGVVGYKSVQEAVAVIVGKGHTHAFTKLRSDPGLLGHISESSISVVSIERIVRCRVVLGMTVAAGTAADRAIRIFIDLPLAIVDDEQIQQPIIVVVEPASARGPHLLAVEGRTLQPRLGGHVRKSPISIVVK